MPDDLFGDEVRKRILTANWQAIPPSSPESIKWYSYYWRLLGNCGKESWRTWRQEMFAGALIGVIAAVLGSPHDPFAGENLRVALLATAIGLGVMGLWHLIRAPWLVERDKVNGKSEKQHWFSGFFGLFIFAGIMIGVTWGLASLYHNNRLLSVANKDVSAANKKLTEENTQLQNKPAQNSNQKQSPPKGSHNTRLKERAFSLISQLRKLAGEQQQVELNTFWAYSAAQGPTGVLTVGTDQEKQNWKENQRRTQQDNFTFYRQKYHDSFMTDTNNMREGLLQRLPPGTRDDTLIYAYKDGFGYQEMNKVAADLERLANMIPDD